MTSESVWHIPFNVCTALKMAQNTKKNRGTNWTPEEKEYLFSILAPQLLAIIEKRKRFKCKQAKKCCMEISL